MVYALDTDYANPSSLHRKGVEVEKNIKNIRQSIAKTLGAKDKEIYFTSGGTESNNTIIRGIVALNKKRKNHIISTTIEHPSVLNTLKDLESEGCEVTYLEVDKNGKIDIEEFKNALTEAKEILASSTVTQEQVDASFDRLSSIMQRLEFYKGDKKALQELVNKITLLNSNDFTKISWDQLIPVLNIANQILANENALVKEVNDAYEALVRAYLNLRYKPNKDLLEDLINTASKLNAKDYTVETYNLLQTVLKEANNVLISETASQEQINQAYNNLNNAIKNLVKVNQEISSKQTALKTGDISITPFVLLAMLSIVCLLTICKKENI